jgi:hypothetical protein
VLCRGQERNRPLAPAIAINGAFSTLAVSGARQAWTSSTARTCPAREADARCPFGLEQRSVSILQPNNWQLGADRSPTPHVLAPMGYVRYAQICVRIGISQSRMTGRSPPSSKSGRKRRRQTCKPNQMSASHERARNRCARCAQMPKQVTSSHSDVLHSTCPTTHHSGPPNRTIPPRSLSSEVGN